MKSRNTFTKAFAALVLIAGSAASFAQSNWSGTWLTGGSNTGCGGVGKTVQIYRPANCTSPSATVTLERSDNNGLSYSWAGAANVTFEDSYYFPTTVINRSGRYRFKISGMCGSTSYTTFTSTTLDITVTSIYTSNFRINGILDGTSTPVQTYSCKPIDLVNTVVSGNTVTSYKLVLRSSTSTGSPTSAFNSNASGTWTTGAVPSPLNLNSGAIGTEFSTNGGYYMVYLTCRVGTCESVVSSQLIHVKNVNPNPVADFRINGLNPTGCGTPAQTYQCSAQPITLSNLSTGAVSYKIDLYMNDTPSNPCSLYSIKHSTGIVSTFPTDAKNLPGGSTGTWLQTHSGNAAIIFYAYNGCDVVSQKTLYFNVAETPLPVANLVTETTVRINAAWTGPGGCVVPQNTQLKYYDGSATCAAPYRFPMQHSSVSSPNHVGRTSTIFDLSQMADGIGATFDVQIKTDKWNGSAWENLNYLNAPEVRSNSSNVTLTSLLQDDPSNPYFEHFLTAANGGIYRVSFTVSNPCGSTINSQIIQLNSASLKTTPAGNVYEEEELAPEAVSDFVKAYPNPANSDLSFEISTEDKDEVSIVICDFKGNVVKEVVSGSIASGQSMQVTTDISSLSAGVYFYKVTVNKNSYNGKVTKL